MVCWVCVYLICKQTNKQKKGSSKPGNFLQVFLVITNLKEGNLCLLGFNLWTSILWKYLLICSIMPLLALEDPVTLRVNVCIVMWLGTGRGRTMAALQPLPANTFCSHCTLAMLSLVSISKEWLAWLFVPLSSYRLICLLGSVL